VSLIEDLESWLKNSHNLLNGLKIEHENQIKLQQSSQKGWFL